MRCAVRCPALPRLSGRDSALRCPLALPRLWASGTFGTPARRKLESAGRRTAQRSVPTTARNAYLGRDSALRCPLSGASPSSAGQLPRDASLTTFIPSSTPLRTGTAQRSVPTMPNFGRDSALRCPHRFGRDGALRRLCGRDSALRCPLSGASPSSAGQLPRDASLTTFIPSSTPLRTGTAQRSVPTKPISGRDRALRCPHRRAPASGDASPSVKNHVCQTNSLPASDATLAAGDGPAVRPYQFRFASQT